MGVISIVNDKDIMKSASTLRKYGMASAGLLMVSLGLMSSHLNDSIFYTLGSAALLFALLATCGLAGGIANGLPDTPEQPRPQTSISKEST